MVYEKGEECRVYIVRKRDSAEWQALAAKGEERAQACVWAVGKFYRLIFPNQIVMVRITRAESVKSLVKRRVIEDGSEITHGHALRPPAIVMLGSHQVAPAPRFAAMTSRNTPKCWRTRLNAFMSPIRS